MILLYVGHWPFSLEGKNLNPTWNTLRDEEEGRMNELGEQISSHSPSLQQQHILPAKRQEEPQARDGKMGRWMDGCECAL